MKTKFLTTVLAMVMIISCMLALTACGSGGLFDFLKNIGGKTDNTQTDDNNDNNDNDDNDDTTPVVYSFATDTWVTIAEVSASGKAYSTYKVGDEKTIKISTDEAVTFIILGFSHDDLADGTGRAGITIGMKDLLTTTYKMSSASSVKWSTSSLRTETLPAIFEQLPIALQGVIKSVKKYTSLGSALTDGSETTEDKLFILSMREISDESNPNPAGAQYAYWRKVKDGKTAADRIKHLGGTGAANDWHYRQTKPSGLDCISSDGYISSSGGSSGLKGLSFAFCV